MAKVEMRNPHTGVLRTAPLGFSWTTFFFGPIVAAIRGDWKWAIIQWLLAAPTLGMSHLFFVVAYNTLYFKGLVRNGFAVVGTEAQAAALGVKYGLTVQSTTDD